MLNMALFTRMFLALQVIWQLMRYDLVAAVYGFSGNYQGLRRCACQRQSQPELEQTICQTVADVTVFYCKPVHCFQRSVVTARVLRAYGIAAELVIGYRLAPPMSHAWVEVGGRVVNDSAGYQRKLSLLERI
jgi:hypothetical protein